METYISIIEKYERIVWMLRGDDGDTHCRRKYEKSMTARSVRTTVAIVIGYIE